MSDDFKPVVVGIGVSLALIVPAIGIASAVGLSEDWYFLIYLVCTLVGVFVAVRPVFEEIERANR